MKPTTEQLEQIKTLCEKINRQKGFSTNIVTIGENYERPMVTVFSDKATYHFSQFDSDLVIGQLSRFLQRAAA